MSKNSFKYLFLSPHMDDAAFSSSIFLKKDSKNAEILSFFTKFQTKFLSVDNLSYIKNSQLKIDNFEISRIKEDLNAMKALGVKFKQLKYVDAGFRLKNKENLYSQKEIFKKKIKNEDFQLIDKIKTELKKLVKKYDFFVIPYGIGGHVDHLIVKKAAEKIIPKRKQIYYLDMPYSKKLYNWDLKTLFEILKNYKIKIYFKQKEKTKIIKKYKSQFQLLYKNKFAPEIILFPRN